MTKLKIMSLSFERTITATPAEVYAEWLDPKSKCNPWSGAKPVIMNTKVGGLFYFKHVSPGSVHPHYGRFLELKRGARIKMTWMSPHTRGLESLVTISLKKKGAQTRLSLRHSNLPNDSEGRLHQSGWDYYMNLMTEQFKKAS